MNAFRDIRVMPVVVVAIFGFAVVKIAGIVLDGGYVFDYDPQSTQRSWAQENLNFPGPARPDSADITGSVDEKKDDKPKDDKKDDKPKEEAPQLAAAPQAEAPQAAPTGANTD